MTPAAEMTLMPELDNFVRERAQRGGFASGGEHVRDMLHVLHGAQDHERNGSGR